ncbi:MAG: hypothetical protein PHX87_00655 [Candidatus Peribacteraceae bacterium]|nr:hypothetical protein [Candidatus Peribacteraceae bacterium]MDD5741918.1 hypothetical protein [Candidatus Peribacteraceae bacterium]
MPSGPGIRVIAGRFSLAVSRRALEDLLREYPFEFCADLSAGPFMPFEGLPAADQEHFAGSEVRNAHYEGVHWNAIAPLDESIIMQMREYEAIFMAMVTRLEWKRSIPYLTRKLWYLRHLQFWSDYLTRHRINLYLSAWVPHEIPDIIIYGLCKLRGIPVLYFDVATFRDVTFPGYDVRQAAPAVAQRYRELLAQFPTGDPARLPLKEPFASYEREVVPAKGKPPAIASVGLPTYWEQLRTFLWERPIAFLAHAVLYVTPAGWKRALGALQRWVTVRRTERFYDAHTSVPDLTRPFVYFPLHYQPEATTLPQGGVFVDQILAVRLLNAALPPDVPLYIKEHPRKSSWLSRSIPYYQDFLELEHVRFVPRSFDTFALREHCSAVATITGSAGIEALVRGKPVFLFGSCYYQYAKGVFVIRSMQDCRNAVRAIFEHKEAPTPWTTHLYMKAMEEACVFGMPDPWYLHISKMSEEQHQQALSEALVREVKKLEGEIVRVAL